MEILIAILKSENETKENGIQKSLTRINKEDIGEEDWIEGKTELVERIKKAEEERILKEQDA